MAAVDSLRTATATLSRNPVLLAGGLVYALLLAPQRVLQFMGIPGASTLLQVVTFLVTPFVLAGVVGMALEGLTGDVSLETLRDVGEKRYVPLLLASVIEFGIQVAFGVALLLVALAATLAGGGGAAVLVVVALLGLLVLAYLLVLFLVQFYPVIVVVDGADAVDGITESVGFVRDNPLATLGFTAVTVVLGTLAGLPVTGFVAYRVLTSAASTDAPFGRPGGSNAPPPSELGSVADAGLALSTPEAVALAAVSVVLTALFFAFRQTYATAFYRRHVTSVEERVLGDL